MKGKRFLYPKRHLVSPDGTIYWIRALRWMQNKTPGVYIPLELMERLGCSAAEAAEQLTRLARQAVEFRHVDAVSHHEDPLACRAQALGMPLEVS